MNVEIRLTPAESVAADALAAICYEQPEGQGSGTAVQSPAVADPAIAQQSGWLTELRSSGEFTGKPFETAVLYRPEGISAKRLVVIGGGKQDRFSPVEWRRVAGALVRTLRPKGIKSLALVLEDDVQPQVVQAVAEGAILGAWEPDKYKTDPKKQEKQIESFVIVVPGGQQNLLEAAVSRGTIVAGAQNFTRDLVNEPPNRLFPADLVAAAKAMSAESGLECEVLGEDKMSELGMGALLGVGQGSSNPPFLIIIRYRPSRSSGSDHLALVGKGVTFDTGGISIKPAENMDKMKYDMAGGAAVIGAMRAIAELKPAIPVTGYIPTVENMLSGHALRPGDILTSLSGKTIEVLNTDAEGRLILADALTYANRNGATHIIDAATLTGAINVALGAHNMGAFTNNEQLLDRFKEAAREAGERVWQLPLEEEYKDYLKSAFADLPNVGGRAAGSITAAWFLKEFADPTPWVHLDIASTAWLDDNKPWISKGPSGVGVRAFTQLALDWNQ